MNEVEMDGHEELMKGTFIWFNEWFDLGNEAKEKNDPKMNTRFALEWMKGQ